MRLLKSSLAVFILLTIISSFIHPFVAPLLLEAYQQSRDSESLLHELSNTDKKILELITRGYTTRQISEILGMVDSQLGLVPDVDMDDPQSATEQATAQSPADVPDPGIEPEDSGSAADDAGRESSADEDDSVTPPHP